VRETIGEAVGVVDPVPHELVTSWVNRRSTAVTRPAVAVSMPLASSHVALGTGGELPPGTPGRLVVDAGAAGTAVAFGTAGRRAARAEGWPAWRSYDEPARRRSSTTSATFVAF